MPELTLRVDEPVAEMLQREARKLRVSAEERATSVLVAHHESYQRFPDGVLREGRHKLIEFLSQVPCLSNFDSSGIDFRFWWVSFDIDTSSPSAWAVVRRLGLYLNWFSTEMQLPTAFRPTPEESPKMPSSAMRWQIESTAALLDPADVVMWLADNLPKPLSDLQAWNRQ